MMKDLLMSNEANETKIGRLKKYMESETFLESYSDPHEFMGYFIPFAMEILNEVEPEKKVLLTTSRNESRYVILRMLNKIPLREVENVELIHVLHRALQGDNLPNVILSLKVLNSLSKSKVMRDVIDQHVNVLLGVLHELFINMENGDEGLIEMSLFAFIEVLSHGCVFFHGLNYYIVKIDQFLAHCYGQIRRVLEDRRFLDLMVHRKIFSIEMCSAIRKLLKLTYEHSAVIPKMSPYYMLVSEVALVGMFYCPPEPDDLRNELCFFFTKICINNREIFIPVVERMYMLPFLFSSDIRMNVKGIGVLSEILGYFKDNLSKTAYLDFGFRTSEVLLSLCHSVKRLCRELRNDVIKDNNDEIRNDSNDLGFHIESIKTCVMAIENGCKCFGGRSNEASELHDFYIRSFYDLRNGYEGIQEMMEFVRSGDGSSDHDGCDELRIQFKELVVEIISGLREVIGRIGVMEKSGSGGILSTSEIHTLYSIFYESFDILLVEDVCQESIIEEFFSILNLIREHIANDIIKYCSEKIYEYSRRNERFFGIWKAMNKSVILGNAIVTYILPRITSGLEDEDFEFIKRTMRHVVPFFSNDVKKIRRVNTFFMHKLISTLMTGQPKNIKYFEILLEIFNIFGSIPEKSSFFQKYIFDNFVKIVDHLMKLHENQGGDIFIEMIFTLPISINLVETDIQFLMAPIEAALRMREGMRVRALSILVYILDFSTPEKVIGLECVWKSILHEVKEGLNDSSTSLICARILGKLKTYHKVLIRDEVCVEDHGSLSLIRLVVDGKHRIPGHSLFFEVIQNIRGVFEPMEYDFGSEGYLIKFRRIGRRSENQEMLSCSFRFMSDVMYYLVGWGFFKDDLIPEYCKDLLEELGAFKNTIETTDYVYSMDSVIQDLCGRNRGDGIHLAQYIYDSVLALFSCYNTSVEREAQQLLHSIFGTMMFYRISSFYRIKDRNHRMFLNIGTFLDALVESFADIGNPLPFRTLSVLFIQAHELLGNKSEDFCLDVYRMLFSKLEVMCKSSNRRCRDAGINGIMCLVAIIPVRELVLLKIPEDAFQCTYLYLFPRGCDDFTLPLRLVLFILRFRYRSMRNYLLSEGTEEYFMMSHFTPFIAGLFDNKKHVVEFSKAILLEIFQSYAPRLLVRHKEEIFRFLREDYVINNKSTMIRHLQVFVFCVKEGRCPFNECEMKYLIGKFMDNILSNDEWKGNEGMGYFEMKGMESINNDEKKETCDCRRNDEENDRGDDDLMIGLGGIHKKLSELSMRDLIELVLNDSMDIVCIECRKNVYRHADPQTHFNNEAEELMYWMKEFYLIVIGHSKTHDEVKIGIQYLLRHLSNGSGHLSRAYGINAVETMNVVNEEIDVILSGKIDYRLMNSLLWIYSVLDMPENVKINGLILKILKEFRTPKEFAIISQDDRYSMLAKAYELGIMLNDQEMLCNEIVETYVVMDGYVKSYTTQLYPRMVEYVERCGIQFVNGIFRKIQEPSIYELGVNLYRDSLKVNEMMRSMGSKFAEGMGHMFYRLEGNYSIDMSMFMYGYRFLDAIGYEMKSVDMTIILNVYSYLKNRSWNVVEMRNMINKNISRCSNENLEILFKLDPLFIAVDGIDVGCFSSELSSSTLKNMVRSIKKDDVSSFDELVDVFGDGCHVLIELFVEVGWMSDKMMRYCKDNLQNSNARGLLLYYLCRFEPLYIYFEVLFKMPYEDRKYTLDCLQRIVDSFDSILFEEVILIVLRSEVRFRTNLYVLFPLITSRPGLISMRIIHELIGSIHKMLNSPISSHKKVAIELFMIVYTRCGELGMEYDTRMVDLYGLIVAQFVHMKSDCSTELFERCSLIVNVDRLRYSSENVNVNVNNVLRFIEIELGRSNDEEYKKELLNRFSVVISSQLRLVKMNEMMIRYVIDGMIWNYRVIEVELREGVRYNAETLYNLLCILCGDDNSIHDVSDMVLCSSIIRYLFDEFNRDEKNDMIRCIRDGLDRIFYVLSLDQGMKECIDDIVVLYMSGLKNDELNVSVLVDKISFLISDSRVTLADKIEMIHHLDRRRYDERVVNEICLSILVRYNGCGVPIRFKLEKYLMQGLSCDDLILRNGFFDFMNSTIPVDKCLRLMNLLEMDWKYNRKIGYTMIRMMMCNDSIDIVADKYYENACDTGFEYPWVSHRMLIRGSVDKSNGQKLVSNFLGDIDLYKFRASTFELFDILYHLDGSLLPVLIEVMRITVSEFDEYQCREVFKRFVKFCNGMKNDDRLIGALIRGFEYIYKYVDLDELIKVLRGGDGWYVLLEYVSDKQKVEIYRRLMDSDRFFGISRSVCCFPESMQGYFLQQIGKSKEAQRFYEEVQEKASERRISFNEYEYGEWEREWINCAKELEQWDVCYEIGMSNEDYLLSAECVWHLSDLNKQNDLNDLKIPLRSMPEGFMKRFYGVCVGLFEDYSHDKIKKCLFESITELRSYPMDCGIGLERLMYVQILIEMIECEPIFKNRIDSIEMLTSIFFRWKDKEPLISDSFKQWSIFSTWRRHVYSKLSGFEKNIEVIRGSGRYDEKKGMSHLLSPQEMIENNVKIRKEVSVRGMNEMARMLNMCSNAAIERGYHDVGLIHLKEVFGLSSIKIGDAFQKVMNELVCLLEKKEYKIGMDRCGSTNIQHFSDLQSSIVFNFKGLFSERLGKFCDAERFYLHSAQICNDVGENWLRWGTYLFNRLMNDGVGVKEEVFLALTQAITHCSNEKARRGILKMILMMSKYSSLCDVETFQKIIHEMDISRFIYFIPQLIGLLEKEVDLTQIILVRISREYFQSVVRPLRITRERLRKSLRSRKGGHECTTQMTKLKMDASRMKDKVCRLYDVERSESKMIFLENVMRIYNSIKNKGFGREFGRIILHLHNSFNSYVFREEELIYHEIEKVFDNAVLHVVGKKIFSSVDHIGILNELISHVSLSSLSKALKDELMRSIFGMRYICALENIDDLVRFKERLKRIVEGSFYRMNKFEESDMNLILHRSAYEHKIFGQYSEIRSNYKNLVNIEMFESRWSYIYRKRIGYNRIHLRGSDGKSYRYEMKGLSEMSEPEILIPQLSLMISEAMNENVHLAGRGAELKIFIPVVLSEILVVECIKEAVHEMNVVIETRLREYGITCDQCVLLYLNHFSSIYEVDGEDQGCVEPKYKIDNGLKRCSVRMNLADECPNIRHRYGVNGEERKELYENLVNGSKMMIDKQREIHIKNLKLNEMNCLGCGDGGNQVIPCGYGYEISKRQRYLAYEKVYNTLRMDRYIVDYFKSLHVDLGGYFRFKRKSLLSYSTNTAFLYSFFIVDRRPENIVFTRDTGCFMSRRIRYGNDRMGSMGIVSPGYQRFYGKEGIEGVMVSVIYHYADMLSGCDWYEDLVRVIVEKELECDEGSEGVMRKMTDRLMYMRSKSDDGTYNVIPMISEWMDTFKLAQVDPRNMPWF